MVELVITLRGAGIIYGLGARCCVCKSHALLDIVSIKILGIKQQLGLRVAFATIASCRVGGVRGC